MQGTFKRILSLILTICIFMSLIVPTVIAEGGQASLKYYFKDGNGRTIKVRTWGDGGTFNEPDFSSNPKLTMAEGSGQWSFVGRSLSGNKGRADGTRVNITGSVLTVYFDQNNASSSTNGDWIALKLANVPAGTYQMTFTGNGASNTGLADVFIMPASDYSSVYGDYMSLTEANAATVRGAVNDGMKTLLAGKQPLGVFDSKTAETQMLGTYTCAEAGDQILVFRCASNQTGTCRLSLVSLEMEPQVVSEDPDQAAANAVKTMIDVIGEVTLNSEEQIVAARAAYDALTDVQKALVVNLDVLVSAEAALEMLKQNSSQTESLEYTFTNPSTIKVRTWGDGGSYTEPNFPSLSIPDSYNTWTFAGRSLSGNTGTADGTRVNIASAAMTVYFTEDTGSSTNGDWIALKLTDVPAGTYEMTFTGNGASQTGKADVFVMPASDYAAVYADYMSLTETNASTVRGKVNDGMKTLLAGKQALGEFNSASAEAQSVGNYTCSTTGDYILVFRCAANQSGNCRLSLVTLEMTPTQGGGQQEPTAVESAMALIDAIGEVTLASKDAIDAARAAYDALPETDKALVTNYNVLTAAEAAYSQLEQNAPVAETLKYSFNNPSTIKIRTEGDDGSYTEPNFPSLSIPNGYNAWTFVGRSLSGKIKSADGTRVNINQDAITVLFTEVNAASSTNGDWIALKLVNVPAGTYKMTFTPFPGTRPDYNGLTDVFVLPASDYAAIYADYMSLNSAVNEGMKTLLASKQMLGRIDSSTADAQTLGVYTCETAGDYILVFRCSAGQTKTNNRLSLAQLTMAPLSVEEMDAEQAKAVIAKIDAIGEVTLDSKDVIAATRAAYDALNAAQKALITNYDVLVAAEAAYNLLLENAPAEGSVKYSFKNPKTIKVRTEGDGGTYTEPNFPELTASGGYSPWTFVGRHLSGKIGSADGTRVNVNKTGLTVYFAETSVCFSSTNGDWIAVKLSDIKAGTYRMIFTNYYASNTGLANVYAMPAETYSQIYEYYLAMDKANVNSSMATLLGEIESGKVSNAKKLGVFDSAKEPSQAQNLGVYTCAEDGEYVLVFQCAAKQSGNCRLSLAELLMEPLSAEEVNKELVAAVIAKIDAIGEVSLSSEDVIKMAREGYDALDAELKKLVTNYSKLTAAEAKLAKMKREAATTYNFVNDKTIKIRTAGDGGTFTEPYFTGLKIDPGYGIWTFVGRRLSGNTGTADGTRVNINQQSLVAFFTEGSATSSSEGDWIAIEIKNVAADMYKMMFTNTSGTANGLSDVYIMPADAYSTVSDYYKKQDKENVNKSMAELLAAIDAGEVAYAKKLEKQFNSEQDPAGAQRLDVITIEKSGNYVLVFRCAENQTGDCRLALTKLNLVATTTKEIEQEEIDEVEALIDAIGEVSLSETALSFARNDYERIKSMWQSDTATYAELGQAILFLIEKIQNVSIYAERYINIARQAYENLSNSQKAKVENYNILQMAEAKVAEIRQELDNEKAAIDTEVINSVHTMINGIGEVTSKSYSQIKKSRVAYNWLTLEQKAMITNYDLLVQAEADYIALTGNFETVVESVNLKSAVYTKFNVGNNDFVATSEVRGHDYLYVPHNGVLYVYDLDERTKVDEERIGMSESDGIFIDSKGIVWVYGQTAFMYRYDPNTGMGKTTAKLYVNGSTNKSHVYYPIEVDGKLYVGSYNMGELAVYNPGSNTFTNLGQLVEGGVKLTTVAYKNGYIYASVHAASVTQNPHVLVKYEIATKQVVGTLDLKAGGFMENSPYLTQTVIIGDVLLGATTKSEKLLAVDINTMQPVNIGLEPSVVHGFSQVITEENGNEKVYFLVRGSGYELYEYNSRTGRATRAAGFDKSNTQFNTRGNSFVTLDIDGVSGTFMLVGMMTDGTVALYNMATKKLVHVEGVTGQDGSAINIIDFRGGPEGSNEIYFGGFMSNIANVYDIQTNTITKSYPAYSEQLETSAWFNDTWYVTGYGACSISEMDYDTGEYKVLFALNEKDKLNFVQERIHQLAYGDNKVFGSTVPHKNILGGFIVWYDYEKEATFVAVEADKVLYQPDSDKSVWRDAKTDEIVTFNTEDGGANDFKGVVENQMINGLFYQDGYLFGTSYIAGGSGSAPVEGANAELIVYDVEKMELVAHYPITEHIEGLVTPVELISVFAPDPEVKGKFWGVVACTLFTATYDEETKTFQVEEVVSYGKEYYKGYISKYKTGQMYFTDGYVVVYFKNTDDETEAGINNLRIINMEDPSYNYSLCTEALGGYVLADDGNIYFERNDGVSVLYTSSIIAAIKENKIASDAVIAMINSIGQEVTLASESAIVAARGAYNALMPVQKALVKNEGALAEAETQLQALQEARSRTIKTVVILSGCVLSAGAAVVGTVLYRKKKRNNSGIKAS